MNKQTNDYGWIGWVIAIIIGIIFIFYIVNSNNENTETNSSETTQTTENPTTETVIESKPSEDASSWSCVDATSYNRNAYDDNKCTRGTETQYVSDSQAIELDPSYGPGKAGASYYNNK